MEGRKLVVVEANEVPLRVVEDLAADNRIPFLASMLDNGTLIQTSVRETVPMELYPSQTWASMNTGVPYEQHRIYWYGDPKPSRFPLYWQLAARSGRSVGLVNSLHSSPVAAQCVDGDYRFVIPDSFSADAETIPTDYRRFQRANTSLTGANSRRASLRPAPADVADLLRSVPSLGLQRSTVAELARLIAGAAVGRVPRERVRSGQFLIQQDLFVQLLTQQSPDLAVFFTNHVAAAMHRYWYAMYPDDFGVDHYSPAWIARYRDEIRSAMVLLDRLLQRLSRWCLATDRTLVIASSMGQGPSTRLSSDERHEAVVTDPDLFLQAIGVDDQVAVLGSMAPQLTLDCGTSDRAAEVAAKLANADAGQVFWDVDSSDSVITLTASIEVVDEKTVRLGGGRRPAESTGITVYPVDDHSSGRHSPAGILGVANSPTFKSPYDDNVDYLDFAPALLQHLGVAPAAHHRMPEFQI